MRVLRMAACLLAVSALAAGCNEQPTALDDLGSPFLKGGNGKGKPGGGKDGNKWPGWWGEGCDFSEANLGTPALWGTGNHILTICAGHTQQGDAKGFWSHDRSLVGKVLALEAPSLSRESWCVELDYTATGDPNLADKNAIFWIRDVGNGTKKPRDQWASRRVDADKDCETESPPPLEGCEPVDGVLGIQCFTEPYSGGFDTRQ